MPRRIPRPLGWRWRGLGVGPRNMTDLRRAKSWCSRSTANIARFSPSPVSRIPICPTGVDPWRTQFHDTRCFRKPGVTPPQWTRPAAISGIFNDNLSALVH